MKFVIAPDKFKYSLTGIEFCKAVTEGIIKILPDAKIIQLPMADGGDGTLEVINYYLNGNKFSVIVNNPLFNSISASYLIDRKTHTAYVEMAESSGLKLIKAGDRDCKNTTTLGTGELIIDAIKQGAKKIILGLGGSATNDCGMGMAVALGYRFYDQHSSEVRPIGKNLSSVVRIDDSHVISELKGVTFIIACDVTNPLYGNQGAAHVYAEQKGASKEDIEMLDQGLFDFSKILDKHFGITSQQIIGAGAAGGLGIGSVVFLNGKLTSGINLIKDLAHFDEKAKDADWIITGEGRLDNQTLAGKVIAGILDSTKETQIKVAAFCGSIEPEKSKLEELGISYAATVINEAKNIDDAIKNSYSYVVELASDFAEKLISD